MNGDRLEAAHLGFVDAGGCRTRYYDDGRGEPLVLIHGGEFGSLYSLDAWSLNLPGLAERFRVVALDKVGQGYTDGRASGQGYAFATLLSHLRAFLAALGLGRVHLVGHSRGALLAARLALEHPELVATLVLVDSNTLAPDDPDLPQGEFYRELERRTPPGPPTLASVRLEPVANSFSDAHVSDDFARRLLAIALAPGFAAVNARMATLKPAWIADLNRERAATLDRIARQGLPAPTLVVWGYNDPSAPIRLAHRLFELIAPRTPHCALHVFNHAGHYVFREHPAGFNALLRDFCLSGGATG